MKRRNTAGWFDHLLRLQAEHTSGRLQGHGLTYNVAPTLVNSANYGVPQKRERVFLVGFGSDRAHWQPDRSAIENAEGRRPWGAGRREHAGQDER